MKIVNCKLKINPKGFTFIDVLVGSALLLIVFVGIFTAYQLGLKVVAQSKNKITATAIATGELEQLKNLPYEAVGTVGGFPEGDLEQTKTKTINGIDYTVETRIDYVVDSADGVSSPADDCPNDYKKVEVEISWPGLLTGNIKLGSIITPENLVQECNEEGGILLIQVFDAYGVMVSSPLIEIRDPDTDEVVKSATPASGDHFFSLTPDSYKVVVSKSGYSTARTYGVEEVTNPEKSHLVVVDGNLTESSFSIDELSSMSIETVGPSSLGYPIVSNVNFDLTGAKTLGTDINGDPVYKYTNNFITNEEGLVTISDLEWDNYTFETNDLDLIDMEVPLGVVEQQPISLAPNVSQNVRMVLQGENSLLVTVQDSETSEPIFSAEVRIYAGLYDVTQYTNEDGETYFIPLEADSYNIEVSLSGYNGYSGIAAVSGDNSRIINLERIE